MEEEEEQLGRLIRPVSRHEKFILNCFRKDLLTRDTLVSSSKFGLHKKERDLKIYINPWLENIAVQVNTFKYFLGFFPKHQSIEVLLHLFMLKTCKTKILHKVRDQRKQNEQEPKCTCVSNLEFKYQKAPVRVLICYTIQWTTSCHSILHRKGKWLALWCTVERWWKNFSFPDIHRWDKWTYHKSMQLYMYRKPGEVKKNTRRRMWDSLPPVCFLLQWEKIRASVYKHWYMYLYISYNLSCHIIISA